MAKPQRFPRHLQIWVPDAMADGLELLAQDGLLSVSDHARQALALYLRHHGALPVRPNGQHKPEGADHARA
jgi:hypothetical protein